ncbi:MAG: hypothetical protein C5B49_07850 [Bdellovibrio sp.]|nr:MAG: hypothetical protein C5B49_07850 [Bdellovibrio sp.]
MPRKVATKCGEAPYHISARCVNREWFVLDMDTVWSIMEDYLYLISHQFNLHIHSFVLMANHFHMLLSAPDRNLSQALLYFMRETSREITRLSGRINQTYGNRNHKTYLGGYHYFMNSYKYVYRNPVRAGICRWVEEYPYSTLHGVCGLKRLIVPVAEDTILFTPEFDQTALNWLNTKSTPDHEEEIRLALRRSAFELKTPRKLGRKSDLGSTLI